ncbi:hypothetical protein BGW39_001443 [Mortierella sp. 14UC]|nr:hypothetical protein BGW39_001443 [Mortierella sp. 14UC]
MGLESSDSLTQRYAAMNLSATLEATPSSSALKTVFSIPELVNAIAPYLNTSQRGKLCLVSKLFFRLFQPRLSLSLLASAFHDPPFGPPGSTLLLPDIFRGLAPRVEALVLDLHSFQGDNDQNAMLETLYEHSAVTLRRLRVSYWGAELDVLEEVVTRLPNLEELSVSFKSSADATAFPEMLIRVAKARQAAAQDIVYESSQHGGLNNDGRGLRILKIELSVPKSKELRMGVLSELLKVWPAITSLELTSFSLKVSPPVQPSPAIAVPPPPPPPPMAIPAPPIIPMPMPAATGISSGAVLLPQQHQGGQSSTQSSDPSTSVDPMEESSFPWMRSLRLTQCPLSSTSLRALDKFFPRLQRLQLTSCPGDWYREIAGVRTSQITPLALNSQHDDSEQPTDVPFVHLQSLRIWVKEQSGRDKILGLFRHRPGLTSVETDVLPDSRDGLLEVAAFCSGVAVEDLITATAAMFTANEAAAAAGLRPVLPVGPGVSVSSSASAGTTDISKVRNRIKRLAIQTYAVPAHNLDVIERLYNAPAFRELEYVYMQNRELSVTLFPFAKTLRELNLGGPDSVMRGYEVAVLNSILHRLPLLEVLKIDRYVDGAGLLKLFHGFGPGSGSSFQDDEINNSSTSNSGIQGRIPPPPPPPPSTVAEDGRPRPHVPIARTPGEKGLSCLRKLRLLCQRTESGAQPLHLNDLKSAVLDRFECLEKMTVRVGMAQDLPKNRDILRWREMVLEEKGGSEVTGCKVVFKLRKLNVISVVM